jgi:formamidopyrimidine-DNA glycosylase
MPELPEVHTTVTMLHKKIRNKTIADIWSDYNSAHYKGKENIKDVSYFKKIRKEIIGNKIIKVVRRAKNILIHLSSGNILLIHMKMTGHLLYGKYSYNKNKKTWSVDEPGPLQDPFNQFVHFVLTFSDNTHLVLSDMRKFATISFIKNESILKNKLSSLGVEPLENTFDWKAYKTRLSKHTKQKIKTALMDQRLIAGIGNIYSDEILWASQINPLRLVESITDSEYKLLTKHTKELLSKGINFGGDSMSDYRNPDGLPGEFQLHHNTYRRTDKKCNRKKCTGTIQRTVLGGRSTHYCNVCQK